jgi:hypothetical protein
VLELSIKIYLLARKLGLYVKVIGVEAPHKTLRTNNSMEFVSDAHPIVPPFADSFT